VSVDRALLELLLSPQALEVLDEHVRRVVAEAVRDELARQAPARRWLTLDEAAREYGCSTDAMRMRVKRGSIESRRQGRRLYVLADSNGAGDLR
jgi:ABC-type sulfate transport system substrate-binding protein